MAAIISFSQGWKNAYLMLENATSITYPLDVVYLKPFKWHSRFPFVFFWPIPGLTYNSRRIGLFPLLRLIFYCSTISSFACF